MMKKLWMKVTSDEYQLPVAVAESATELAKMVGVTPDMIYHRVSAHKHGITKKCSYICVEIDEDNA